MLLDFEVPVVTLTTCFHIAGQSEFTVGNLPYSTDVLVSVDVPPEHAEPVELPVPIESRTAMATEQQEGQSESTGRPADYHSSTSPSVSSPSSGGLTNDSEFLDDEDDYLWISEQLPDLAALNTQSCDPPAPSTSSVTDSASAAPPVIPARPPSPPMPPPPYLDMTEVPLQQLINNTADMLNRHPASRLDVIRDAVVHELRRHSTLPEPQERAIRLAVDFGVGLTATLCRRLFDALAARYSSDSEVPTPAILTFVLDELSVWGSRAPGSTDSL